MSILKFLAGFFGVWALWVIAWRLDDIAGELRELRRRLDRK